MISEAAATTDSTALIVLGAFTLIGTIVTAILAYLSTHHAKEAKYQSTQANDAVNHVHVGGDRLFDMVADTRNQVKEINQWKERWDGLPEELSDAPKLVERFGIVEDRIVQSAEALERRVERLDHMNTAQHEAITLQVHSLQRRMDRIETGTPQGEQ